MSNENTNQDNADPTNNPVPRINSGNTEANQGIETNQSEHHHRNYTHHKKPVIKRVVRFLTNDKKQPLIANIITLLMVGATAILAVYTIKLLDRADIQAQQSIISAKAAQMSANAAKQSADLQKQALDSQIAAKKQSDISDAKKLGRDTDFINKQKAGIDSQIEAMHIQQKEFEIENRPLVGISNFTIDTPIQTNKKLTIKYIIVNSGKQPVKCIGEKTALTIASNPKFNDFKATMPAYRNIGLYLSNTGFIPRTHIDDTPLDSSLYNRFRKSTAYVYFMGTITYENTVTLKYSYFNYKYKISFYPNYDLESILEEISDKPME